MPKLTLPPSRFPCGRVEGTKVIYPESRSREGHGHTWFSHMSRAVAGQRGLCCVGVEGRAGARKAEVTLTGSGLHKRKNFPLARPVLP